MGSFRAAVFTLPAVLEACGVAPADTNACVLASWNEALWRKRAGLPLTEDTPVELPGVRLDSPMVVEYWLTLALKFPGF